MVEKLKNEQKIAIGQDMLDKLKDCQGKSARHLETKFEGKWVDLRSYLGSEQGAEGGALADTPS